MRTLFAVAGVLLAWAGAAFAQETTSVTIVPLVDFVLPIILAVITAVLGPLVIFAVSKWTQKTGLVIEAEKRDALQTALTNAAAGLVQQLGAEARDLKLEVRNPKVAAAVQRVINSTPDAVKWAGLTQDEIAKRILEKIPQVGGTTVRSHWLVGALAVGGMLLLSACDPNKPIAEQKPDFGNLTPNQLCVTGMNLAAATQAILAAAETKQVDLLDKPVQIGGAVCAQIAAMGSPSTLR